MTLKKTLVSHGGSRINSGRKSKYVLKTSKMVVYLPTILHDEAKKILNESFKKFERMY